VPAWPEGWDWEDDEPEEVCLCSPAPSRPYPPDLPAAFSEDDDPSRRRTVAEIRDVWLKARHRDGSNWAEAIAAVYDLGFRDGRAVEMADRPARRPGWLAGERCECGHLFEEHVPLPGFSGGCEECQAEGCECGKWRPLERSERSGE